MMNGDETVSTVCSTASMADQQGGGDGALPNEINYRNHRSRSSRHMIPVLFQLIRKSDWERLRTLLDSELENYMLCQEVDSTKLNCLTLALVTHAPIDVVHKMLEVDAELLYRQDIYGATPLHLACLNGSSIEKIDAILRHDEEFRSTGIVPPTGSTRLDVASILDNDRRSSLHHAVEYTCSNALSFYKKNSKTNPFCWWIRDDPAKKSKIDPAFQAKRDYCVALIKVLCETSSEMVFKKCKHGLTPIDILHIHKVKLFKKTQSEDIEEYRFLREIYKILKETSIKQYKKKKLLWELDERRRTRRRSSGNLNSPLIPPAIAENIS